MSLPPTASLLGAGGDLRIALDPASGLNRYLCPSVPTPTACFGSATASVISPRGFAAADRLRDRLAAAADGSAACARELDRVRTDIVRLCGLGELAGLRTALAPSGTDIHRLAARLVAGLSPAPTTAILVEPEETGSGVPPALSGGGVEAIVNIPARGADGAPRPMAALSRGLEQALDALPPSRRALVVLADVTKTGLISLDPAAVFAAARRHAGRVEVLVDACQFRLAPTGLRAYLDNGAMVAVTGSKFLGGPSFSGALFVPPPLAGRFGEAAVEANPGLLLRWEAALAEFESFAALADETVDQTLRTFAAVVTRAIEAEPGLELLTAPPLDRSALGPAGWDSVPTIFSFLLRHGAGGPWFSRAQTHQVYRTLATRAGVSLLLGQPVACGRRDGMEVSALRFCASAPLVVEAAGESGRAAVLDRIGAAFSDIAGFARTMPAG